MKKTLLICVFMSLFVSLFAVKWLSKEQIESVNEAFGLECKINAVGVVSTEEEAIKLSRAELPLDYYFYTVYTWDDFDIDDDVYMVMFVEDKGPQYAKIMIFHLMSEGITELYLLR